MNRGGRKYRFGPIPLWCILGAALLSVFLAGCGRPPVHTMVDEAFALIYPELSSKIVRKFPLASIHTEEAKSSGPYLSYPLQTGSIESLLGAPDKRSSPTPEIFVTTPAIAEVFPVSRLDGHAVGINLLAPADSFLSIEWDSEWAYRELGLIAGYRLASLRKQEGAGASAAMLFSRGTGRGTKELDAFRQAFTQAFEEGFRLAAPGDAGAPSPSAADALSVFDVDSMNLPGDRLEQVLSALRQVEDTRPRLLVLASGSRLALETSLGMKNVDIVADVRGLGSDIPARRIFAAIGENDSAFVSAIGDLAQKIEKREAVVNTVRVKPDLILSKEARRIQAVVHRAARNSGAQ